MVFYGHWNCEKPLAIENAMIGKSISAFSSCILISSWSYARFFVSKIFVKSEPHHLSRYQSDTPACSIFMPDCASLLDKGLEKAIDNFVDVIWLSVITVREEVRREVVCWDLNPLFSLYSSVWSIDDRKNIAFAVL